MYVVVGLLGIFGCIEIAIVMTLSLVRCTTYGDTKKTHLSNGIKKGKKTRVRNFFSQGPPRHGVAKNRRSRTHGLKKKFHSPSQFSIEFRISEFEFFDFVFEVRFSCLCRFTSLGMGFVILENGFQQCCAEEQ